MIAEVPHPRVPELRMPNSPLKLTETPPSIRRPPPLLGQHNQEVLAETRLQLPADCRTQAEGGAWATVRANPEVSCALSPGTNPLKGD